MKKLLSILALIPALCFGAAENDIAISKVRANGFNTQFDFVTTYKAGELQFVMFDGSGLVSTVRKVGSSIACDATTCEVSGGGAVNWSSIVGKPTFSTVAFTGNYTDLLNLPTTFAPAAHTHAAADTVSGVFAAARIPALGISQTTGLQTALDAKADKATTLAGYGIADGATSASLTSGLAAKQNTLTLTTTGSGAATLIGATLNIPTPVVAAFNFSQPTNRSLSVSTSYQALDNTKAAVIYPSYACQNATTVLAASGCTIQVRMGTGTLTCSTGTVYYTQSLTVALGVLITQNSTNPVPIMLPASASFILCPTTGTFTITAVEQSAG